MIPVKNPVRYLDFGDDFLSDACYFCFLKNKYTADAAKKMTITI